jgi:pSer/pThr/pTyr-binding forkhead associated (FHA) protein
MGFRLRYLAHDLELPVGEFVVGRSTECQLSLDDPLVSRRHAVLRVRRDGVTVEDLGSRNGVAVNGTKIAAQRELSGGDRIGIGSQEMVFQATADSDPSGAMAAEVHRRATQTLGAPFAPLLAPEVRAGVDGAGGQASATPPVDSLSGEVSRSVQSFRLLGGVADKALALGKAEDAERILMTLLADVLTRSREAQPLNPALMEPAARYAARLAGATGKASWVNYVFELYANQRRVLPGPVVDELYVVIRKARAVDLAAIRAYLDVLREQTATLGPAERFVAQRIEGLERQLASK